MLIQRLVRAHNLLEPWSLRKGEVTSIDFSKLEIALQQKSVMKNQGSSTNSEQGLQTPSDPVSESVFYLQHAYLGYFGARSASFQRRLPTSHLIK